jgi:uncharacterized protein
MSHNYPELYLEGIRLFNAGEFFECHDVLEELWTETVGEEREFYQGLIHAAVALFHFENENLGGARKMYSSARRYLEPYGTRYMGIDLAAFLAAFEECFCELLAAKEYPQGMRPAKERVPRIELSDGP